MAQSATRASLRAAPNAPPPAGAAACELTILIPCLNEAETLTTVIRKASQFLERSGVSGEVLVADNGSTDGSQAIAKKLGARVTSVPAKGYGAALLGGIAAARGEFIVMGDADDSYDFTALDAFVKEMRGGADLVMGNRFEGGIGPGAMPFLHRYLGNPVLSWLGRLLFGAPVKDFHCGLRGIRRDSIDALGLTTTGMEFASEMVVRACLQGLTIAEVPTTLSKDGRSRPPHLRTWRDGWRHLRFLLLHSPRWTFFYPGAALIGTCLAAAAALAPGRLQLTPALSLDVHSFLLACIGVLVGMQLVTFGAMAQRYAERSGLLPVRPEHPMMRMARLEPMLLTALGLFAAGVAGIAASIFGWSRVGFGDLYEAWTMRVMIASSCAVAAAVQLGFSGFLLALLDLPAGDARRRQAFLDATVGAGL